MGHTGKSVSRSYSRALDCLVSKKATIKGGGVNPIRSPGQTDYDNAMAYLTTHNPDTGLTPVDIYVQKQAVWADAQDTWDQAKINAQRDAKAKFPNDIVLQRQDYDEWNLANFRKVSRPPFAISSFSNLTLAVQIRRARPLDGLGGQRA